MLKIWVLVDEKSYNFFMYGLTQANAIEACEKLHMKEPQEECFIALSTKVKHQTVLIEIKNSFTGEMKKENGKEYPDSMKEDAANHGIGMNNMKRIAEKYYGNLSFQEQDTVFVLWITLQNQSPNE